MNRFLLRLLRSPLRSLLGRRVCALRFRGRRTGLVRELPVEYVRTGDRLVVLAGRGAGKTWWRNFGTRHPLEVLLDGDWHGATGTALLPGDDGRTTALAGYRSARPRVPADTADPVVVVDLERSPAEPPP